MLSYRISYLSFLLIIGISASLFAQNLNQLSFSHLDETDGLVSNTISQVIKDPFGIIWIATSEGLVRYDSFNDFKHFNPENTPAIKNSFISALAIDQDSILWIGTKLGGLASYNPLNGKWQTFLTNADTSSISSNEILVITVDHENKIWVGTENGLNILDIDREHFIRYQMDLDNPYGLKALAVLEIYEDTDQNVWLGTWDGGMYAVLNRNDFNDLKFRQFIPNGNYGSKNVWTIRQDHNADYWVGTHEGGLFKFDLPDDFNNELKSQDWDLKFINFLNNLDQANSISANTIFTIIEDQNKNLWIGTTNGLNILSKDEIDRLSISDADGVSFIHYGSDVQVQNSLSQIDVNNLFIDDQNIVWISTYGGLNFYNPFSNQFENFILDNKVAPNSENIAFFKKKVWVARGFGGLKKFDLEKKAEQKLSVNLENVLRNKDVKALSKLSEFELVILTNNEIVVYNLETERTKIINIPQDILERFSSFLVKSIFLDKKNRLWLGTELGLFRYDFKTDAFKIFDKDPGNPKQLTDGSVTCIEEGSEGQIWVGTYNGLNEYIEDGDAYYFKQYKNNPLDSNSIPANTITSLDISREIVVLGTDNGVFTYNSVNRKFHSISNH